MKMKTAALAALVTLASACSGGSGGGSGSSSGGGSASPPSGNSIQVLRTFSDNAGVARISAGEDGQRITGTLMAPEIRSFKPEDLAGATPDLSGLQVVDTNQHGRFYEGRTFVNGMAVDVLGYEDFGGNTAIVYGETAYANILLAGGTQVRNIPTGSYTYRGTNVIGTRDGTHIEDGTFEMGVNFGTGRGTLRGSTDNTSINASNISVNSSNGTFSSTDMSMSVGGQQMRGSINGNFHGSGAVGVTGVYHNNASNPGIAGAIAGTR
jgi:hypothetical protein